MFQEGHGNLYLEVQDLGPDSPGLGFGWQAFVLYHVALLTSLVFSVKNDVREPQNLTSPHKNLRDPLISV